MTALLLLFLVLLAFANGANDNCKGVATLVGYGAARPRQALAWATLTTALGAGLSFWAAGGLVRGFSTGLFMDGTRLDTPFFTAVLVGACGWVLLATRLGLPVSTTHAITGALTGAGLVAFGTQPFEWSFLGTRMALPLAVSPVASLALVYLLGWPVAAAAGAVARRCVCVAEPLVVEPGGAVMAGSLPEVVSGEEAECAAQGAIPVASGASAMDRVHWLTSGLVGFARGWNDAPKIAALGLVALGGTRGAWLTFALVTAAMAAGGLVAGRRVLETLARKVTPLPRAESLTASGVTALLVGLASWNALPVSTTHVSTGAIVGAGLRRDPRGVHWARVGEIGLSWLVTLPVAALLAAAARLILR